MTLDELAKLRGHVRFAYPTAYITSERVFDLAHKALQFKKDLEDEIAKEIRLHRGIQKDTPKGTNGWWYYAGTLDAWDAMFDFLDEMEGGISDGRYEP